MEVESIKTQQLATVHLLEERLTRFVEALLVGVTEIDKVAIVWQNLRCGISRLGHKATERVDLRATEWGSKPLTLILGKESEGRSPNLTGIFDCILHAARSAYMCSYIFHILSSYLGIIILSFTKIRNFEKIFVYLCIIKSNSTITIMRHLHPLTLLIALLFSTQAIAQVSIDETAPKPEKPEFENEMKSSAVEAEYFSEAAHRAERRAIRNERNSVDLSANLHGSLTAFSESWQASGDNAIAILANINFKHTYKKNRFSITNVASAKLGYNNMKTDVGDGTEKGLWFKNVDELAISTAPQWDMVKNWTYGANVKFRTQLTPGYNARTSKYNGEERVSNFLTPGYLDASIGFTYVVPSIKFPLKINLAPIAMSGTYVLDQSVYYDAATDSYKDKAYGVAFGHKYKHEGGLSVQLDFDRSWGKDGWLRYRTTAYSFYGWITDITSAKQAKRDNLEYEHVVPTLRWENTIDIKATKYFSTQIYVQLYYNKAEVNKLQVQSMLSVGLTYTFKNK